MREITDKDINNFLVYVYSNERMSLTNNPFQDNKERDNLEKSARIKLNNLAEEIMERNTHEN